LQPPCHKLDQAEIINRYLIKKDILAAGDSLPSLHEARVQSPALKKVVPKKGICMRSNVFISSQKSVSSSQVSPQSYDAMIKIGNIFTR
jgi:hypothetical protein